MTLNPWSKTIASAPATSLDTTLIRRYAPVLTDSPAPEGLDNRLLMESNGDLTIYYAPFEHHNPRARIVLVGITPDANLATPNALLSGKSDRFGYMAAARSLEPAQEHWHRVDEGGQRAFGQKHLSQRLGSATSPTPDRPLVCRRRGKSDDVDDLLHGAALFGWRACITTAPRPAIKTANDTRPPIHGTRASRAIASIASAAAPMRQLTRDASATR